MISGSVQLIRNDDGRPNLLFNDNPLHSRRDPLREAERQATIVLEALNESASGPVVVVGIGWGYLLEVLARRSDPRSERILFLEPVPEIQDVLESAGRQAELEALFPGRLFGDKQRLHRHLKANSTGNAPLVITPTYRRIFPKLDLDSTASTAPALHRNTDAVNQKTAGHFFLRWGWNFARRLAGPDSMAYLESVRTERNFLYVGAGPGMVSDLSQRLSERAIGVPESPVPKTLPDWFVVAADTALAPLLALGVAPDLVISVDSGPGTEYHFRSAREWMLRYGGDSRDRRFVFPVLSWAAGPLCLDLFFQRVFFYRSTFPLDQLLGAGPLSSLPNWSNLSRNTMGLVLLLAAASGHDSVFTAGADFQARDALSHTRGTGYTMFGLLRQTRLTPLSSYRPGGYARELTSKNRATVAGLRTMAEEYELRVHPLASTPNVGASGFASTNIPDPVSENELRFRSILTESLRGHLIEHWPRLPFKEIALESGTPHEVLLRAQEKWLSILKNGGQGFL